MSSWNTLSSLIRVFNGNKDKSDHVLTFLEKLFLNTFLVRVKRETINKTSAECHGSKGNSFLNTMITKSIVFGFNIYSLI